MSVADTGKFILNGDATLGDGINPAKFEVDSNITNTIQTILTGNGGTLTIENKAEFVFPSTGSIYECLSGITNGSVMIKEGGEVNFSSLYAGGGSSAIPISGGYKYIGGNSSDFTITGSLEIQCIGASAVPVFVIPNGSKLTVTGAIWPSLNLSVVDPTDFNAIPLNTSLTIEAGGELVIPTNKILYVYTTLETFKPTPALLLR